MSEYWITICVLKQTSWNIFCTF